MQRDAGFARVFLFLQLLSVQTGSLVLDPSGLELCPYKQPWNPWGFTGVSPPPGNDHPDGGRNHPDGGFRNRSDEGFDSLAHTDVAQVLKGVVDPLFITLTQSVTVRMNVTTGRDASGWSFVTGTLSKPSSTRSDEVSWGEPILLGRVSGRA